MRTKKKGRGARGRARKGKSFVPIQERRALVGGASESVALSASSWILLLPHVAPLMALSGPLWPLVPLDLHVETVQKNSDTFPRSSLLDV